MKKFKQLAMLGFLLCSLFLLGSTSVNAQYVSQSEALELVNQELIALNAMGSKGVSSQPEAFQPASQTATGTTSTRAKRLLYSNIMAELKDGQEVGTAISTAYVGLAPIFSGNADRTAYLDEAEQAAQDLLEL